MAVYLNGEEIGRTNLPAGALGRATRAASSGESRVSSFRIPGEALLPGRNVLAASVHNSAIDSSDLSFVPVLIPVLLPPEDVVNVFRRGDVTDDGNLNLTDAVRVLNFLFLGGEAPGCADVADADDNGRVELTDPIRVLNHLFLGGAPPPAPGTECGEDPTPDDLGECSSLSCAGG